MVWVEIKPNHQPFQKSLNYTDKPHLEEFKNRVLMSEESFEIIVIKILIHTNLFIDRT